MAFLHANWPADVTLWCVRDNFSGIGAFTPARDRKEEAHVEAMGAIVGFIRFPVRTHSLKYLGTRGSDVVVAVGAGASQAFFLATMG